MGKEDVVGREGIDIAVLGAVEFEVKPLVGVLEDSVAFRILGEKCWKGRCGTKSVVVGTLGLNKVNAAITTAAFLERLSVSEVWHVGCAGAYPQGGLRVGDVLLATRLTCGDEGVLSENGVVSTREIGIPILIHDGRMLYDHIPLDDQPLMRRVREKTPSGWYWLGEAQRDLPVRLARARQIRDEEQRGLGDESGERFRLVYGPSLTVSMASGDGRVALKRFRRYGSLAENMEGSAVVQTCFRYNVPVLECRGISNTAGDRRRDHWRMDMAMAHCHGIVVNWLDCRA